MLDSPYPSQYTDSIFVYNQSRIMPDIRAFIAIELPQEVQTRLAEVQQQIIDRKVRCVRWVSSGNIHLTLQFLGDTSAEKLEVLGRELYPVIAAQEPFTFQVQGLSAFPNVRRPRVIWVGLQAPFNLTTLQNLIERTVQKAGLPVEDRGFSPHLTLGRVKRDVTPDAIHELTDALNEIKTGVLGTGIAKSVTLFRSDLRPEGPIYTPLTHFPLQR